MNKYIWGSVLLILLSLLGILWMNDNSQIVKTLVLQKENVNEEIMVPTQPTASQSGGQAETKGGLDEVVETQDIFDSAYNPERKLYIEKEYSGVRYVLWKSDSKITVHIGNNWSWVHPGRDLTETGVVPGQTTFTYNIAEQKIVDFEIADKKITVQCVHNGVTEFKEECSKFLKNFKLI